MTTRQKQIRRGNIIAGVVAVLLLAMTLGMAAFVVTTGKYSIENLVGVGMAIVATILAPCVILASS